MFENQNLGKTGIFSNPSSSSFHTACRESQGRTASCSTLWSRPSRDPTRPSAHHSSWSGTGRTDYLEQIDCHSLTTLSCHLWDPVTLVIPQQIGLHIVPVMDFSLTSFAFSNLIIFITSAFLTPVQIILHLHRASAYIISSAWQDICEKSFLFYTRSGY